MKIWRVYHAGRDFGIDYLSLAAAREAKAAYAAHFIGPYYIRAVRVAT